MLAFYLDVDYHFVEELPSNHQVFRSLGRRPDDEISILLVLYHLYCRLGTYVPILGVSYSPEFWLTILQDIPFLLFVLSIFNDRPVILSQLKPILFQVNRRMNRLDDSWEARLHAVMPHIFMPIGTILMREVKAHFYFQKFLFFSGLVFPKVPLIKRKANDHSFDKVAFLIYFLILLNRLIRL